MNRFIASSLIASSLLRLRRRRLQVLCIVRLRRLKSKARRRWYQKDLQAERLDRGGWRNYLFCWFPAGRDETFRQILNRSNMMKLRWNSREMNSAMKRFRSIHTPHETVSQRNEAFHTNSYLWWNGFKVSSPFHHHFTKYELGLRMQYLRQNWGNIIRF